MTPVLEAVVCALAAVTLAAVTAMSIRSGRLLWYPPLIQVDRSGHPALFWTIIVTQLAGVLALAWLSLS